MRFFTNPNASNRLSSLIKTFFERSREQWPICEKYPILLPVAPLVAIGKYLKRRKEGKRDAIKPLELYKKAGARQKLYKELKPFVVEKPSNSHDDPVER